MLKLKERYSYLLLALLSIPFYSNAQNEYETITKPVQFATNDGIVLYGDLAMREESKGTILLFHQGGSNVRGEYINTLPRFYSMGYTVLAMDLRSGGSTYGNENRTVAGLKKEYGYCDSEADIKAAIDYIISRNQGDQVILIGSSFSASLVIRVAAENKKQVKGVLAFSPSSGGPMSACRPDDAMKDLDVPLIVFRPEKEMAIESVSKQLELAKNLGHKTYVAKNGVHGSSLLTDERVGGDASESWVVVTNFLAEL